jgi:hypothetical protein
MYHFAKIERWGRASPLRLSLLILWFFASILPLAAQPGGQFLAPPSLPPNLPGGAHLPNLPPGAQREIAARSLEAAMVQSAPAPAPRAAPNLSSIEAFFAERLEQVELRQFGYDTFRGGAAPPPSFGALPGS